MTNHEAANVMIAKLNELNGTLIRLREGIATEFNLPIREITEKEVENVTAFSTFINLIGISVSEFLH